MLALAAVAPLVAAYFLRRRQRPRQVSALFLWSSPSQRAQAGPKLERFSREASLALEVDFWLTARDARPSAPIPPGRSSEGVQ